MHLSNFKCKKIKFETIIAVLKIVVWILHVVNPGYWKK